MDKKRNYDQFTAVFNCHINNAGEKAIEAFKLKFNDVTFIKEIKPFLNDGIMSIFDKEANEYTKYFVHLIQKFVNEEPVCLSEEDIRKKIDEKKYELKVERMQKLVRSCHDCDNCFNAEDFFCSKCGSNLQWYHDSAENFKAFRKDCKEKENALLEQFKKDCFHCFGVQDHPKADRCYNIAWEKGHSSGLYSVFNEFCELVELLID